VVGTFLERKPSVVLAVDLRQAAEKEVGEIGEGGGPVWRNAVLDDEQGQASHTNSSPAATTSRSGRIFGESAADRRRKLDARELWHRRVVMRLDGAEMRPKGNATRADIALLVRADVFSNYEQAS
jgi:hypothetical protein